MAGLVMGTEVGTCGAKGVSCTTRGQVLVAHSVESGCGCRTRAGRSSSALVAQFISIPPSTLIACPVR